MTIPETLDMVVDPSSIASFVCPILFEVMVDPVIDKEGNSYERSAIEAWLRDNSTSPLTRSPMTTSDLAPNRALKEAIEALDESLRIEAVLKAKEARAAEAAELGAGPAAADSGNFCLTTTYLPPPTAAALPLESKSDLASSYTDMLVSLTPPRGSERMPVDICCCVDISGSMGAEAIMQNESGETESHGLSLLDVVKHAINTVIETLGARDRLSLVSFHTEARMVFRLIPMNDAGKKRAREEVNKLRPEDCTNIWDALQIAFDGMAEDVIPGRTSEVLLLTDGVPNRNPPRGIAATLRRRIERTGLPCPVTAYGFGYNIDVRLLDEIAGLTRGRFSFIPDASFVGTVFVNSLANLLTTAATDAKVKFITAFGADDGAPLLDMTSCEAAGYKIEPSEDYKSVAVALGQVQYGQTRDIIVRVRNSAKDKLRVEATCVPAGAGAAATTFSATSAPGVAFNARGDRCRARQDAVIALVTAWQNCFAGDFEAAQEKLTDLVTRLKLDHQQQASSSPVAGAAKPATQYVEVTDLSKDIEGEAKLAVQDASNFRKWGQHYLPSLAAAHREQRCNNFKDPGVQHYGGELFRTVQDHADDAFSKLPAPKPSVKRHPGRNGGGFGGSAYQAAPAISMASYNMRSNGCIHGDSAVSMAAGGTKRARDLAKGDRVRTPDGGSAVIKCVVASATAGGKMELCTLDGGLRITPYHPVQVQHSDSRRGSTWIFPHTVAEARTVSADFVYTFVLGNNASSLIADGTACVALGHGLEGPVVGHDFFGTSAVIENLRSARGWSKGLVRFAAGCLVRDARTAKVKGYDMAREI